MKEKLTETQHGSLSNLSKSSPVKNTKQSLHRKFSRFSCCSLSLVEFLCSVCLVVHVGLLVIYATSYLTNFIGSPKVGCFCVLPLQFFQIVLSFVKREQFFHCLRPLQSFLMSYTILYNKQFFYKFCMYYVLQLVGCSRVECYIKFE